MTTITQLPTATVPLNPGDAIPIAQSGVTKQAPVSALTAAASGGLILLENTLHAAEKISTMTASSVPPPNPLLVPVISNGDTVNYNISTSDLLVGANGIDGTRSGQDIDIAGGTGATIMNGGNVSITAGAGGTTSGAGGNLTVTLGDGGSSSGAGGNFNLTTGSSSKAAGGNISVTAGDGGTNGGGLSVQLGAGGSSGSGGGFVLSTGIGGAAGGDITLSMGSGDTTGNGGSFTALAGDGGASSGTPGDIVLIAGAASAGTGGSVFLSPGVGPTNGRLVISLANVGTVDPHVAGAVWRTGTTLMISTG